jgi:hypothetical protein
VSSEPESSELDTCPLLRRLLLSVSVGLGSALIGALLAFLTHPLVRALGIKVFTGWGAFLWLELGALFFGIAGFIYCWKRTESPVKPSKPTE